MQTPSSCDLSEFSVQVKTELIIPQTWELAQVATILLWVTSTSIALLSHLDITGEHCPWWNHPHCEWYYSHGQAAWISCWPSKSLGFSSWKNDLCKRSSKSFFKSARTPWNAIVCSFVCPHPALRACLIFTWQCHNTKSV